MGTVLWILLLLPGGDLERPIFHPERFTTKDACLNLGQELNAKGKFTCLPSLQPIELAGRDMPPVGG